MRQIFTTTVIFFIFIPCLSLSTKAQNTADNIYYDRLYYLCKFWGHMKYRHSEIAKGTVEWDEELFRAIPKVKAANSNEEFNEVLLEMSEKAGEMTVGPGSLIRIPDELNNDLDTDWIYSSIFSDEVSAMLDTVRIRFRPQSNVYITRSQISHPLFDTDNAFNNVGAYPSEEVRAIAVFRYWNIIHYFFPYKDIMDEHWDSVLVRFIPLIIGAKDRTSYHLAFKAFTANIDDSHAFFSSETFWEWDGNAYPPFLIRFIENKTVITKVLDDTPISVGSIIKKIDDVDIDELRDSLRFYAHGSNDEILDRTVNDFLAWGNSGPFNLTLEDSTGQYEVTVERNTSNRERLSASDTPAWRTVLAGGSCNVGIIDMGKLETDDVGLVFQNLGNTDALIFDIRNYPNGTLWTIVNYLYKQQINIANFTVPDAFHPGRLSWQAEYIGSGTNNPYSGKIAILFDERTQSQAEYTVMGLEQFPEATKIGSTTSGADGNVSRISLPGGIATFASFLGVFYPDYTPTQRIGILPDIEVRPTIEGIRSGKDEILEYALDFLGCDVEAFNAKEILSMNVFPNPTNDILSFEIPSRLNRQQTTVEVIDSQGRVVYRVETDSNTGEIDMSPFSRGMYYVRTVTGNEISAKAVVKN